MRLHEERWPVVPRPFADELFGSWFGRVAGVYRMNVDELASTAGLQLDFGQTGLGYWLAASAPRGTGLQRLASLCRLTPAVLANLGERASTSNAQDRAWYCHKCLFLNPLDVRWPYWRAPWLGGQALPCRLHGEAAEFVSAAGLAKHKNMPRLLKFISRRRSRREFLRGRR